MRETLAVFAPQTERVHMNDTELDRLLNTWSAPASPAIDAGAPPGALPRVERPGFARPLKWALVGLCSLGLTIAIAQTGESHGDALLRAVHLHIRGLVMMVDAHRASLITAAIRQSQPKVYVDGELAAPLGYGNSSTLRVDVPGDGVYYALFFSYFTQLAEPGRPTGWVEAGSIHGNVIEFQAGGKQVRIECNQSIVDGERPVFVRRQPGQ